MLFPGQPHTGASFTSWNENGNNTVDDAKNGAPSDTVICSVLLETYAEHDGVYTTSPAADVKSVSPHGTVSHVSNTPHPTCGDMLTLYALQPGQENMSDKGSQPATSDKLIPVTLIPASPTMLNPAKELPNSLWGAPSVK